MPVLFFFGMSYRAARPPTGSPPVPPHRGTRAASRRGGRPALGRDADARSGPGKPCSGCLTFKTTACARRSTATGSGCGRRRRRRPRDQVGPRGWSAPGSRAPGARHFSRSRDPVPHESRPPAATAWAVIPPRPANSVMEAPSAQPRTIRQRRAHACGVEGRRTHPLQRVPLLIREHQHGFRASGTCHAATLHI